MLTILLLLAAALCFYLFFKSIGFFEKIWSINHLIITIWWTCYSVFQSWYLSTSSMYWSSRKNF